jgi:hypothetical protein
MNNELGVNLEAAVCSMITADMRMRFIFFGVSQNRINGKQAEMAGLSFFGTEEKETLVFGFRIGCNHARKSFIY